MTLLKPIEILTPNILEEGTTQCSYDFDAINRIRTTDITFTQSVSLDTLILKETDGTNIKIATTVEGQSLLLGEVSGNTKSSLIIRLEQNLMPVNNLQITVHNPQSDVKEGIAILCKSLLVLSEALTTLTRNDYTREGYHYLANGNIVKWHELTKFGCNLRIENLKKPLRDAFLKYHEKYTFLTYIFYGEYDEDFCYQVTSKSQPSETFDRRTRLYTLDCQLLER